MKTIKSKQDFEKVFRCGRRVNHHLVRVSARSLAPDEDSRIAFVAAKRLGNAVYRNRCKRILRAAARKADFPLAHYEVILFSTHATHEASSDEVAHALTTLAKKLRV